MGLLESGVLASIVAGVLASIVTAIITITTTRKQNRLQYITAERKNWREEIRNIASRIMKANERNIGAVLVDLKVRINAFGMSSSSESYEEDAHIWKIINAIEKPNQDSKMSFEDKKNLLVEYLSLLLKKDWEGSKREVNGDWLDLISYSSVIMALLSYSMGIYFGVNNGCISITDRVSLMVIFGVLAVAEGFVFFIIPKKSIIEAFMSKSVKYRKEAENKKEFLVSSMAGVIYFVFQVSLVLLLFSSYEGLGMDRNNLKVLAATISWILFGMVFFACKWHELYIDCELKNQYNDAINKCREKI